MKTLTKILVPAVLSIAAFSAQAAGNGQIPDYGTPARSTVAAPAAAAAASVSASQAIFRGEEATRFTPSAPRSGLTRAEVQREAAAANRAAVGTDRFATSYGGY